METEQYFYTGKVPINTRLMREAACEIHGRSVRNGLCSVSTKPIPPEVYREVMKAIEGRPEYPQPHPEVVRFYEAA